MTAAIVTTSPPSPRSYAPVVKFVGGKRRLFPAILARLPVGPITGRYFEPFVGGGAVFFELASMGYLSYGSPRPDGRPVRRAVLADVNIDLVNLYIVLQRDPIPLVVELQDPDRGYVYDKDAYYRIRALDPDKLTSVQRAARMIYLNKCGFNGLYRVNKSGGFNVPFGRYVNPTICDENGLLLASDALQRATDVRLTDFEILMEDAREGDVCYCDSPYAPASVTSNFTSYTQDGFSFGDQERLRDAAKSASRRGAFVLLSNSDVPMIRKLYSGDDFQLDEIMAARAINSDPSKRGSVKELLIRCVAR